MRDDVSNRIIYGMSSDCSFVVGVMIVVSVLMFLFI